MLNIEIPGVNTLKLIHLVLDFNGTLAADGKIIDGVKEALDYLSKDLHIHIITADTFGTVKCQAQDLPARIKVLTTADQAAEKAEYIRRLGCGQTAAIGNGANDRLMLKEAALGILVIGPEGCSAQTLQTADIITGQIRDALALLQHPKRIGATLRV